MILLALAVAAAPAKLVILYAHQPPAIIDYPSMSRCERAAESLRRQSRDPKTGQVEQTPEGGYIVHTGNPLQVYCIPG